MERFRVRTIKADMSITLLDYSFSQICSILKGMDDETKNKFWDKISVDHNGENLKFVREVLKWHTL